MLLRLVILTLLYTCIPLPLSLLKHPFLSKYHFKTTTDGRQYRWRLYIPQMHQVSISACPLQECTLAGYYSMCEDKFVLEIHWVAPSSTIVVIAAQPYGSQAHP